MPCLVLHLQEPGEMTQQKWSWSLISLHFAPESPSHSVCVWVPVKENISPPVRDEIIRSGDKHQVPSDTGCVICALLTDRQPESQSHDRLLSQEIEDVWLNPHLLLLLSLLRLFPWRILSHLTAKYRFREELLFCLAVMTSTGYFYWTALLYSITTYSYLGSVWILLAQITKNERKDLLVKLSQTCTPRALLSGPRGRVI